LNLLFIIVNLLQCSVPSINLFIHTIQLSSDWSYKANVLLKLSILLKKSSLRTIIPYCFCHLIVSLFEIYYLAFVIHLHLGLLLILTIVSGTFVHYLTYYTVKFKLILVIN